MFVISFAEAGTADPQMQLIEAYCFSPLDTLSWR